jgi:hypothetical protein
VASAASAGPQLSRAPRARLGARAGLVRFAAARGRRSRGPLVRGTRVAASSLLLAGLLAGCAGEEGPIEPLDLERLALVPIGSGSLLGGRLAVGYEGQAPSDFLLVDRHEVTRGLWMEVLGTAPPGALGEWWGTAAALPAVGMDRAEAEGLAAARGMRLPTASEWLWIAAGAGGQAFPYGVQPMQSAANTLEVGLGRAVAVGTFVSGRIPGTRIADLVGNVWEWCAGPPPASFGAGGVMARLPLTGGGETLSACAMGGSWLEPITPLHGESGLHARGLDPRHRAVDLGLRCVADASVYLGARAGAWSDPRYAERVRAVGEAWGSPALALLTRLASEPGAPAALGWLREGASR